IRSAWLLERGLRRFSAAATETEPRCRTQRKKATSRQRAKPASSAGVSPSSAWVFNRLTTLRRLAIKNGVEQGHGTQSNGLGIKDLWPVESKRPTIPFVQCAAGNGPAFPGVGDRIFTFVLAEMRVSGCS